MAARDQVFALDQHRKNLGSALSRPHILRRLRFCPHTLRSESRIIELQQQLSVYPKRLVDEEGFPLANVDVRVCRPRLSSLIFTPLPTGAHGPKFTP
jgi:hypothetical protein